MPITGPDKSVVEPVVQVAAAAIFNPAGEVLLARRPPGTHQGGLWEFPGGKLEAGETPRQALSRELHEELDIHVQQCRPLIRLRHDYPDKSVLLDVWRVDGFSGVPRGCEGQAVEWVAVADLPARAFPAANLPILRAVALPPAYMITGPAEGDTGAWLTRLEARLAAGVNLVQLRAHELSTAALAGLARKATGLCRSAGATLLVNAPPGLAAQADIDGIHLTATQLRAARSRPVARSTLLAASCHNAAELAQACHIGVDFAVLGPVQATASHPQATPLGWEQFRSLTETATLPVYALGGVGPADKETAWCHGGQGVAGIQAFW